MKQPIVGFAGMTHLGINSAIATAEKGFPVVCFDLDSEVIEGLKKQNLPVAEPQLSELLKKNFNNIVFTDKAKDLFECDVVYIAPDVPTDDAGRSDLSPIESLIATVSQHLNAKAILVILCQVPPGFVRRHSREGGNPVYYQVETLIFGRAIERALYPERFIVGCADPKKPLPAAYQTVLDAFQCPILPMRYESAELAKISINCCLVASVSVANTLSEICEQIGADWSEIVPALKLDKRIGPFSYLAPGLGIAGGNLERDLTTIIQLAEEHGTDAQVVSAWVHNSRYRRDWVLKMLHQKVLAKKDALIAVLGLAYKEDTHSIKNSPALALLQCLATCQVKVYDPVVSAAVVPHVEGSSSALEAATHADVLIIMTPWSEFRGMDLKALATVMNGRIIIDPYAVLDQNLAKALGFQYLTLGINELCYST